MERQRIALDMDDVMADALGRLIAIYEEEYGQKIDMQLLRGKYLKDVVPSEHSEIVSGYLYRKGFFGSLEPIEGCMEIFPKLYEQHDVFIVTAAMQFPESLREKHDWLATYFPFVHWKNIVMCGDKSIIKADYLVDDHAYNLETFLGKPLLFSSMHNHYETRFPRINSWKDLGEMFL